MKIAALAKSTFFSPPRKRFASECRYGKFAPLRSFPFIIAPSRARGRI